MNPELHTPEWCEENWNILMNPSNLTYNSSDDTYCINGTWWPPYDDPTDWREVDYVIVLKVFAYAVLFVGGLLGNVSVILAVCLNRSMRNTTNYYVANLAVADAMICLFCISYHVFSVFTKDNHFVLGAFMCKFSPVAQVTCLTSGALTLSAISCDRLMAILFPLRARVTKQRTSVVMTIIWILSVVVSAPFLFTREQKVYRFDNFVKTECREQWPISYNYDASLPNLCYRRQPLRLAYHVVITMVLFFVPLLIMVSAYSLILWRLWRTEVPGEHCVANVDAHTRAKRKVSGCPLEDIDGQLPDWFMPFNWFAYFLAFANSFLNPFIYGGFNKEYLKGFCSIFRCGHKGDPYSGSARSRLTFTTGLSSRNASKSLNRISQKSAMEMKLLQRLSDDKNLPKALNS